MDVDVQNLCLVEVIIIFHYLTKFKIIQLISKQILKEKFEEEKILDVQNLRLVEVIIMACNFCSGDSSVKWEFWSNGNPT